MSGGIVTLKIGQPAPEFSLPGVDGTAHTLSEYALKKVLVVVFTCNHCPYAQAYEDRLILLSNELKIQGVQFVLVNANDTNGYPEGDFAHMQERAAHRHFPFPYLRDETQKVAKAYGPDCTPDCFVFDSKRTLRYHGRIDDNWRHSDHVKECSLNDAIGDVLSGNAVAVPEKPALGCSVKWK